MQKKTKADIIKKIIDLRPEDPGSISEQYIHKKNGKRLGPYYLWQSSKAGKKVSIRLNKSDVTEIKDYIKKMKTLDKIHNKKTTKLLDTYLDTINDISPGATPPVKEKDKDKDEDKKSK